MACHDDSTINIIEVIIIIIIIIIINGCNDVSFGDHSVLEGDRIPPLKSHGQVLLLLRDSGSVLQLGR